MGKKKKREKYEEKEKTRRRRRKRRRREEKTRGVLEREREIISIDAYLCIECVCEYVTVLLKNLRMCV